MRSSLKNWLDQPLISRVSRAERREVPGLIAYHYEGAAALPDLVCNISASGMYLRTSTRWVIGSPVELILQRQGQPETYAENRIVLKAKPVRWGPDGVGLTFLHSQGTDVHLWDRPAREASDPIEPVDVVREFRVARAEAFLRRICPTLGAQASRALRREVGSFRTENVIEIALRAEQSFSSSGTQGRTLIHPDVLRQILEHGSWADIDWTRGLWANLLLTSCSASGTDRASLNFAVLLSQMNLNQTRLLDWVCGESAKAMAESGATEPVPVECAADQLKRVTGVGDLVRVEREIDYLADLGMMKKRPRTTYFGEEESLTLAPTPLGMDFHLRSRGQREFIPEMFKVAPAVAQSSLNAGG